jgi:hypothetical protein
MYNGSNLTLERVNSISRNIVHPYTVPVLQLVHRYEYLRETSVLVTVQVIAVPCTSTTSTEHKYSRLATPNTGSLPVLWYRTEHRINVPGI